MSGGVTWLLGGNPWECDCRLAWLLGENSTMLDLQSPTRLPDLQSPTRVLDLEQLQCRNTGDRLLDSRPEQLLCR